MRTCIAIGMTAIAGWCLQQYDVSIGWLIISYILTSIGIVMAFVEDVASLFIKV